MNPILLNPLYQNPHALDCPWYDAARVLGAPNIKWCETTLCSWISEPANTWSNILYLVFGMAMYLQSRRRREPELRWMGPAMFLMGAFSLFYHASNFYISQIFDFVGMYLFVFWLLVLNLRRVGWISRNQQAAVLIVISVACTLLLHGMYLFGLRFQMIVAGGVAAILVTEWLAQRRSPQNRGAMRWFFTGLAFIAAAQTASLLDVNRILCDPDNHWLQGHAVWHILAAIGLYCAYLHYRALRYEDDGG